MAFEEHKNRKLQYGNPYADFEYVNKNSRKTGPGLILALIIGVGMILLAWWRYNYLSGAEESGATVSMTSIEWGLYKLGGKLAVTGVFIALACLFIILGVRNFQRLEKIRKS